VPIEKVAQHDLLSFGEVQERCPSPTQVVGVPSAQLEKRLPLGGGERVLAVEYAVYQANEGADRLFLVRQCGSSGVYAPGLA
jgi:hypothetical protein